MKDKRIVFYITIDVECTDSSDQRVVDFKKVDLDALRNVLRNKIKQAVVGEQMLTAKVKRINFLT